MRGTWRCAAAVLAGLSAAQLPGVAWAQAAVDVEADGPAQAVPQTPDAASARIAEVDQLTGACLALQAEQRALRESVRASVAGLNSTLMTLIEAAKVLADPAAQPEGAAAARARVESLLAETAQIERWLWGEELPERPGVTRASLRERLVALRQERENAELMIEAYTLAGAFDREQMRTRMLEEAEVLREAIGEATLPMRDRLSALEVEAAREGETFERVMAGFGRITDALPVAVEAVTADGWFQHGLTSLRWYDRRGRLVASARVRLRPSVDRDLPPPLLLDRFAIIAHTEQEATVSVGYFTVEFRAAMPEVSGEQQVLDTLVRLLDLEALGAVRPAAKSTGQN